MNWFRKIIYAGLPVLKERKVLKQLRRLGFELLRQESSHQIWHNPSLNKTISVPISGKGDVAPGTLHKIITKEIVITVPQFLNA